MKRVLIVAACILAFAGMASAQTVVGTLHDLSGNTSQAGQANTNVDRVCVFCHTPHQSGTSVDPLWNHTMSANATYGVYASTTLNSTPTEIGGGSGVSNLCMSCHDGTVAVHSLYNDPNEVASVTINTGGNVSAAGLITGNPNVGIDLSNDHPVNFAYDAALAGTDGGLVIPDSASSVDAAGNVPLFGGFLQCASCHDPHNDTNAPFLVVSNVSSALCLTCHTK